MTLFDSRAEHDAPILRNDENSSRFWWRHTRLPLALFVPLAALFAWSRLDVVIAHALFFDEQHRHWLGADSLWANEVVHTGGQWLVRCLVAAALALWIASYRKASLLEYRRPAAFFIVSVVVSVGFVGLLKTLTNVHCPWALTEFGGVQPYLHLFSHRPAAMRVGHCFPAAHSSSGYALIALYFAFRERSRVFARIGIAVTLLVGLTFGLAQQSRGAHFVSHDLWSAFLVWMVSLSVYTFAFKTRLWRRDTAPGVTVVSDALVKATLQQH